VRWLFVGLAVLAVFTALTFVPYRASIPPLVEADYVYQLIAVDRLFLGEGLTSLQPVAPTQPWEWRYDWGFLTQWPAGYPLLVCAVRCLTGGTTVQAAQWLAVGGCALALVGWFVWLRRAFGGGVCSALAAALAAGCSLSAASLINPSTDTLLAGLMPFVLLMTQRAVECQDDDTPASGWATAARFAAGGLLAGGLFWIRYASVFLPAAICVYLLLEMLLRRSVRLRCFAVFSLCAALPIVTLVLINSLLAADPSIQTQLNLGSRIGFDLSVGMIGQAWWLYTDLGFYDYRPESHWLLAVAPLAVLAAGLVIPQARGTVRSFVASPAVMLGGCTLACLLATLIGATAVFGDKYDYVSLERYYLPARPLYFLLFAGPVLLVRRRLARIVMCLALLIGLSWTTRYELPRPLQRWHGADRQAAPSGAWAVALTPGATELYEWLREQDGPDLIVFSNFHDYIAFETGIPANPIPPDRATANRWISRIASSRGIVRPRVAFVLDADNRWRDYYLPEPIDVIREFRLHTRSDVPAAISAGVFDYQSGAPDG